METVTISKTEYEELLENRNWINALEDAGVDNWDGIDYARQLFRDIVEDDEDDEDS